MTHHRFHDANDGARPSRLALDRYHTGELDEPERAALEARFDEGSRAHLADLDRAKADLGPPDLASLRARAARLGPVDAIGAAAPRAANTTRWFAGLAVLAAAMLAVIVVGRQLAQSPVGDVVTFRGADTLELFEAQGRELVPWGREPLGAGDVIGFKIGATGHDGVVLLSVDGGGELSVFWPESGDAPEPISGDGLVPLPGTVTLDGAPGPEVFVAVYDRPVAQAKAAVARAWAEGGPAAVLSWAESEAGVDAVEVPRR